jgi:hypothetical protein
VQAFHALIVQRTSPNGRDRPLSSPTRSISIPVQTAARIDWHKIGWHCYECQKGTQFRLPSFMIEPHYTDVINN